MYLNFLLRICVHTYITTFGGRKKEREKVLVVTKVKGERVRDLYRRHPPLQLQAGVPVYPFSGQYIWSLAEDFFHA